MREQDVLYRFLIENADLRGVVVRLDESWETALSTSDYPQTVKKFLGESMVACAILSASIKFEGKLTFQVRGGGPLNLLVVQVTQDGDLRGLAQWQTEPPEFPLSEVFGTAQMSISITGAEPGKEYRGLVEIVGDTLVDALQAYFERSEQLDTRMWFSVSDQNASGFMLQKLPGHDHNSDDWNRLTRISETITDSELSGLPVQELLHRLYHEDDVTLFAAEALRFKCSCSRERVASMIQGLGLQEAKSILEEQGNIEVRCEFCNRLHLFDAVDVGALFSSSTDSPSATTRH